MLVSSGDGFWLHAAMASQRSDVSIPREDHLHPARTRLTGSRHHPYIRATLAWETAAFQRPILRGVAE